jgi:hypothetical protein
MMTGFHHLHRIPYSRARGREIMRYRERFISAKQ